MRSTTSRGRAASHLPTISSEAPAGRRRRCRRTFRRRRRRRPAVRALPLRRSRRRTSSCQRATPRSRGRACGAQSETSRSIRGPERPRRCCARSRSRPRVRAGTSMAPPAPARAAADCHRPRHQIYPRVQQRRPVEWGRIQRLLGNCSSADDVVADICSGANSSPPWRRSRRQRAAARPYVRRGCTVRRRRAGPFRHVRRRWPAAERNVTSCIEQPSYVRACTISFCLRVPRRLDTARRQPA